MQRDAVTGKQHSFKARSASCAGDMMAYQLSESGSDWSTIKVKAIGNDGSATDLPDECKLVRFSCLSWTHDGKGFFYNKCVPTRSYILSNASVVYIATPCLPPPKANMLNWSVPRMRTWFLCLLAQSMFTSSHSSH